MHSAIGAENPMKEEVLGRWLLTDNGLEKGHIRLIDGEIEEVCFGSIGGGPANTVIMPGLVNSHVHLGDCVAYPAPKGSVKDLVCPPNGYKHRILATTPTDKKVAAMREAVRMMVASGTALFGDFREEGVEGVRSLSSVVGGIAIGMRIFGRPLGKGFDETELDAILSVADGIGMSALSDWPYGLLERVSKRAKSRGKAFAMHASEASREDIDSILRLRPDFVVHMCSATDDDVRACVDARVPIVVCSRSNEFFGLEAGIPRLLRVGATVALGTDNGMIVRPDMLDEMKASYRTCRGDASVSPMGIVRLATFNGRKVLNAEPKITTEINEHSDLLAVRVKGDDPLLELVTGSGPDDIVGIARGGKFRRTGAWTR
jgi:cytosine/adenosine deaminase-related metal-dependent hydrolase